MSRQVRTSFDHADAPPPERLPAAPAPSASVPPLPLASPPPLPRPNVPYVIVRKGFGSTTVEVGPLPNRTPSR